MLPEVFVIIWIKYFSGFRRQQQEEAPAQPHHLHDVPVARVGEGVREVALSGCLQQRGAGNESQSTGS